MSEFKVKVEKSSHERTFGYYEDVRKWFPELGKSLGKSLVVGRKWRANRRASELPGGHSICYLSIEGESVWENLQNRRSRPHAVLRPYVLAALKEAGVEVTGLRWSQKAGCSCPCSPGWILQGAQPGHDYWATVSLAEIEAMA